MQRIVLSLTRWCERKRTFFLFLFCNKNDLRTNLSVLLAESLVRPYRGWLLRRYGHYIRLDERRLKLGQYLFIKHGSKVVFFGRFVAVLRAWAAFLAGTNRMRWASFLLFNALGGIVWATLYGVGGYFLGENVHRLVGPLGILFVVLVVLIIIGFLFYLRRNERRLEDEAEQALPGPLDKYQPGGKRQ